MIHITEILIHTLKAVTAKKIKPFFDRGGPTITLTYSVVKFHPLVSIPWSVL